MSLKLKIISVMAVLGFIAAVIFAVYTYRQATGQATSDARKTADMLIGRAVQMFIVSTKRFHEDFQRTADKPVDRKRIMADWNRTIFAVDQAVIHDHGADQPRVRLIGDKSLFNYRPLGEANTAIQIPFETEAGKALLQGRSRYEKIENDVLRVSIPLPSQAHPGCAECHFTEVEGKDGDSKGLDMSRNIVLGALNAYVPLAVPMARAKEQAFWSLALVFLVIAVLITAIGFYVARFVVRPINGIVDQLDEGGDSLVGSTEEISRAAQSLAEGTGQQAAAIEQTSASLEEMASMTRSSADSAQQADALMAKTNQVTHRAEESMDSVTQSMDQIAESGAEISKIVKSIDEIAFQTNLLALNAAVEAARAGEAGAGFAVVADEVRNLAMRAAEAAKNTQLLIEDTVKRISDGSELVSLTRDQFQEVGQATGRIAGLISEIASASGEQAQGIDQIRGAISQMDQVVQQNASNAEESAAAAAGMDAQARTMQESVSDLNRLISGDRIDQARTSKPADRTESASTGLIGIEDQRGRFGRKR